MRFLEAGVLLVGGLLLMSLDDVAVRQAAVVGMGECSIRQMESLPRSVDVIALGSSRVRTGISTEAISQASGGELRRNFNFGRSGISALRSYVTLRDILDRGTRPRFVYMEVDLLALLDDDTTAPVQIPPHAAIMTYADADSMAQAHPELDGLQRARLRWLGWLGKVRGAIIPVLTLDPWLSRFRAPGAPVESCQGRADFERTAEGERALESLRTSWLGQKPDGVPAVTGRHGAPGSALRQQELFYVRKVGELVRNHGAVMVVARPGRAYEAPLPPDTVAAIRRDIPEFVQPPEALLRATWPDYLDAQHMGPGARAQYSSWLAGYLLHSSKR